MTKSDSQFYRELQDQIQTHLFAIEELLGPRFLITMIARCSDAPRSEHADILLTKDKPTLAIGAIYRFMAKEPDLDEKSGRRS